MDKVYTSRESAALVTDKKVVSITPKPVPTDKLNPYKVLDHDKTKIKLMINDLTKKDWATFNISVPQMDTLLKVADLAQAGLIGNWAWDDISNQTKIFGTPDAQGYSIVNKLVITRQAYDNQGVIKKYPWYIGIEKGKGISQATQNGGHYLKGGTYIKETAVSANLRDSDFKEMLFWTSKLIDVFINGTKGTIFTGYQQFVAEDKAKGSYN